MAMEYRQEFRIAPRAAIMLAAATLLLAGCGDSARRTLGWDKAAPDEFTVVTRAPLTTPPDYDLRVPAPGAVRPQEGTTSDQAKKVLIGPSGTAVSARSPGAEEGAQAGLSVGQQSLLRKAGADKASPAIRKEVDEESTALVEESKSFTDDILFWRETPPPGEVVDPEKEAKRLEANSSLGKPATEGDTPTIVRKQKGFLEGIF